MRSAMTQVRLALFTERDAPPRARGPHRQKITRIPQLPIMQKFAYGPDVRLRFSFTTPG